MSENEINSEITTDEQLEDEMNQMEKEIQKFKDNVGVIKGKEEWKSSEKGIVKSMPGIEQAFLKKEDYGGYTHIKTKHVIEMIKLGWVDFPYFPHILNAIKQRQDKKKHK